MVVPTVALAATSIAIAAAAGPLYALCRRTAAELLDPRQYVEAVLG
jgi:formate hydrogenlyase subunit 3/multisubunit Na+/H+ antiporter MnhD subunit